jgi:hypothetical protein
VHPGAGLDQDRATGQERLEDDVAQLLVLGYQRAQPLRGHLDHLARVAHHRAEGDASARQQPELADEPVRPVDGDDPVLLPVAQDDRDRPGLDDEEIVLVIPLAE